MKRKIPLVLFFLGVGLLPLLIVFPEKARIFLALIEILWGCAYFVVVINQFRARQPISTRGGVVHIEDNKVKYYLSYSVMFLFGAIFLLVVLIVTIVPK